jgi:hypothetical protein
MALKSLAFLLHLKRGFVPQSGSNFLQAIKQQRQTKGLFTRNTNFGSSNTKFRRTTQNMGRTPRNT